MIVERLQYIDTMRGFAIFFVVLGHVIMYGYHTDIFSYNQILIQIYLPLFFFISGFLFKLPTFESKNNIYKFLIHKIITFIIPTFFFILIYDCIFNYSIYDSIISGTKYGYWFTISLFEYQIIFLFITLITNQIKLKIAKILIWLIFIIISLFAAEGCMILSSMIPLTYLNLIGAGMLRFFCFFFVGTLIKRHFNIFCNWINNRNLVALALILFTIAILINEKWNTAIMPNNGVPFVLTFELQFFLIGILGVIITFVFFYKNEYLFTKKTFIGKYLQYIGRKTLNIYFLHYFFLPRNLEVIGQFFKENSNPSLEFLISIMISIWVILLSLIMSKIICLSEIFVHYLFRTKSNR